MRRMFIIFLLFVICINILFAQFKINLNGGLTNTEDSLGITFGGFLSFEGKRIETILSARFGFKKIEDIKEIKYTFLYDLDFIITRWFELYITVIYELLNDLNHLDAGLGGKFTYYQNDYCDFSISLIPFYSLEYESYELVDRFVRLSFRHRILLTLFQERLFFRSVVFYKPAVLDFKGDYIVDTVHMLTVKVTDIFGLSIGHKFTYTAKTESYNSELLVGLDFFLEFKEKKTENEESPSGEEDEPAESEEEPESTGEEPAESDQ
jgi:hypothetical protein